MPSTLHQARAPRDAFQIIARPLRSRTAASKKKRGSRQIGIDHADFSSHHHYYQTQGDRDARFHTHPTKAEPRPLIVSMLPHPACRPGRFESRKQPARNPSRLDDMPAPLPRLVVCHTFAFFLRKRLLRGLSEGDGRRDAGGTNQRQVVRFGSAFFRKPCASSHGASTQQGMMPGAA